MNARYVAYDRAMKRTQRFLAVLIALAVSGIGAGAANAEYAFRGETITYYFQSHTVANTISYADGYGRLRTRAVRFAPNLYLGGKQQYWFNVELRAGDRLVNAQSMIQSKGNWTYCRLDIEGKVESKNWGRKSTVCR